MLFSQLFGFLFLSLKIALDVQAKPFPS